MSVTALLNRGLVPVKSVTIVPFWGGRALPPSRFASRNAMKSWPTAMRRDSNAVRDFNITI